MNCDVHPDRDMRYYLEERDTGNCYYFCNVDEIMALVNIISGTTLAPCGHSVSVSKATWPQAIGLVKP